MKDSSKLALPLGRLVRSVSFELNELSLMLSDIEGSVLYILRQVPDGSLSGEVLNIQKFDYLSQSLSSLSNFLETIGEEIAIDIEVSAREAIDGIHLKDLARRIECGSDDSRLTESVSQDPRIDVF